MWREREAGGRRGRARPRRAPTLTALRPKRALTRRPRGVAAVNWLTPGLPLPACRPLFFFFFHPPLHPGCLIWRESGKEKGGGDPVGPEASAAAPFRVWGGGRHPPARPLVEGIPLKQILSPHPHEKKKLPDDVSSSLFGGGGSLYFLFVPPKNCFRGFFFSSLATLGPGNHFLQAILAKVLGGFIVSPSPIS